MSRTAKIPKATITRLSLYCRQLELMEFDGYRTVSSEKLAWSCQVNPAQVRKDLGYFGEFGIRGVGYDVRDLQFEIKRILSINREWNMGIVGIGNLGSALMQFQNFPARGFKFVAAFDSDPDKAGKTLNCGLTIEPTSKIREIVPQHNIEIGVLTTPALEAQRVSDLLMDAGIGAILNFTATHIRTPECCIVENVDLALKLENLAYHIAKVL